MIGSCLELWVLNQCFRFGSKRRYIDVRTEEVCETLLGELFEISGVLVAKKGGSNVPIF